MALLNTAPSIHQHNKHKCHVGTDFINNPNETIAGAMEQNAENRNNKK